MLKTVSASKHRRSHPVRASFSSANSEKAVRVTLCPMLWALKAPGTTNLSHAMPREPTQHPSLWSRSC
jgi:hypothetical protein